jgi:archaetidylinositol phosphate synthase
MAFNGDKKEGHSLLHPLEKRFLAWAVPKVPNGIETYHLTITTILWSIGIVVFSFLAKYDIRWLWAVSFMIFCQYITDLLDGAIGRARNTGLIKWGFYMDHFLDYIFLCSILIGYSFLVPDRMKYMLFFVLAIFGGYMMDSYLAFAATNSFKITHLGIGPTEIRLLFITINTLLIIFGKTYLVWSLPYALILSTLGLVYVVYENHKQIWNMDMDNKKNAYMNSKKRK